MKPAKSLSGFASNALAGKRSMAALAVVLSISGCATPRLIPIDTSAYWTGRLALQILKEPPESMTASFELQGTAQSGELILLSPLGTTMAKLEWTPQRARLEQGSQQLVGTSLQSLTSRLTGTELPIAALFQWLAGHPADAQGWQVNLSEYAQGRITAERLMPQPATVLRIALTH